MAASQSPKMDKLLNPLFSPKMRNKGTGLCDSPPVNNLQLHFHRFLRRDRTLEAGRELGGRLEQHIELLDCFGSGCSSLGHRIEGQGDD
jgi:hypothetical protein